MINHKRLVVAGIILPLLVSYIYFLPPSPYFLILLICVSILAMREFYIMYKVSQRLYLPIILMGGILLISPYYYPDYLIETVFATVFLLLVLRLLLIDTPSGSMKDIGTLCIGLFYISWFLNFQWLLINDIGGKEYIFLLYSSVWLGDSMAYYVGTYLGKNKLYSAVSPNKTIEGAFGSLLGGAVGAVIIKLVFNISNLTLIKTLVIGVILGIATIIGDLIESMFKRDAGVKDSGNLIPAHGGILDKIDGLLIAGPVLYFLLRWG
ncbi:MAG: phosphatidate cytidylyltransferase [Nitrospirae bacterium]|nr:phosphatidate cytidylyltransferase [Nitrospirota bacterium]